MAWSDKPQVQRALLSRYASKGVRVHVLPELEPGLFTTDGMIWWIAGTESTAQQVCQWRYACPTRSCSSTLSWTPSSTDLPRHRRRGGLGSEHSICQNFVPSSKGVSSVMWGGCGGMHRLGFWNLCKLSSFPEGEVMKYSCCVVYLVALRKVKWSRVASLSTGSKSGKGVGSCWSWFPFILSQKEEEWSDIFEVVPLPTWGEEKMGLTSFWWP